MSASAGRVLILPKGEYDATVEYKMLDLVTYQNGSYLAKQTTTGNLPTDATYWQKVVSVEDMTGASAGAAGVHGLVPAPAAGDQGKYLKGDGTWATLALPSDMTGASAIAAGTHGLTPAPAAGDQAKFLRGDATWATVDLSSKADQTVIGGSYNAATAYEPGDRFSYNGVRYKVIIESGTVQGQTPPNATYYEVCSVDDDISQLNNSLTVNNTYEATCVGSGFSFDGTRKYLYRNGGAVSMWLSATATNQTISTVTPLFQIPSDVRPKTKTYFTFTSTDSNNNKVTATARLDPDGYIYQLYSTGTMWKGISIQGSYSLY